MKRKFDTLRIILANLASLHFMLSVIILTPLIVVFAYNEVAFGSYRTIWAFVIPAIISLIIGVIFRLIGKPGRMTSIHAMLITVIGWTTLSLVSSLVFLVGSNVGFLDALFETVGGYTTTGITIFTGLEYLPKSILFFRALLQWLGGLGILTFFLAVVFNAGAAHSLIGAESHKIGVERPAPGLFSTLSILWSIYVGFTVVILFGFFLLDMSFFDSICHAFTTISTGGFSNYDDSIGYFRMMGRSKYIYIEYLTIFGMIVGGMNFLIHYKIGKQGIQSLFDDSETRYYFGIISLFTLVVATEHLLSNNMALANEATGRNIWIVFESIFRNSLFQVISIMSSTGYRTVDIASPYFGEAAKQIFLILMIIGGSTGSTSGGFKVLRIVILIRLFERELYKIFAPRHALTDIVLDGRIVDVEEIQRVGGLLFAWFLLLFLGGIVTAVLSNYSAWQSFSGMFSALGNIGPCYIPASEMGNLHSIIKVVYIIGMLAGRLEIIPVILLFSPRSWK